MFIVGGGICRKVSILLVELCYTLFLKKTFSSFIEICKIIVDFRFKLMSRDGGGGGGGGDLVSNHFQKLIDRGSLSEIKLF